jgi:hypothetical protein
MQPLNQNERTKAFVNFTIFFLVVVVLILTTAFFGFQVPFKDNERLREINKITEAENEFRDKFQLKLSEIIVNLDAINKEEFAAQAESNDSKIQEKISELSALTVRDSISNKEFYRRIADMLGACRLAKKEVRDMKAKGSDAEEWKEKYRMLDQDYRQYREEVARQRQLRP